MTDDSGRPPDGEDSGSLDPTHAFVSPASAAGRTPRDQAPPATPAPPPRRIGPYEILDLLGEGGMGTVYLAEQTEPLRRRVAVKLIRAGELRSERAARFRAEGRALARMSHPCVAQVFEAGVTDDGQPFLVMELVSGEGIVEHCDRRRLSLEERLRLFVEVCHGVQHAHQKGIIHRDLKPTNVLVCEVDGRAVPKLIDFGIAKGIDEPLLDRTALTADHRVVGTPAYVSPEMIQGEDEEPPDIDTRSDVYSLGVVLYELLTGVLPFGQSARSFVQIIQRLSAREDPPQPSRRVERLGADRARDAAAARGLEPRDLIARLAGDLDWIAMKALAVDREQRYDSAAALAEDLERHLAHEPVLAGPRSRAYRARKFARRHKAAVASGLLVALALMAGIVTTTIQARRANREAETARQVTRVLVDLFRISDPGEARGETVTAREILDHGADRIATELADRPVVRAALLDTIGTVYSQLGMYRDARPLLEEGLELRERHLGAATSETAESAHHLALAHHALDELADAEALFERALVIQRRELDEDDPALATTLSDYGYLLTYRGAYERAEAALLEALAIQERALHPGDPRIADTLGNLGLLYRSTGETNRAKAHLHRALDIQTRALGPEHPDLAPTVTNLAAIYYDEGNLERAETLFRRDLEISEKTLGPEHPDVAISLNNLATALRERGRFDEAEALYGRSIEIRRAALGDENVGVAVGYHNLAGLHREQGDYEVAASLYRRSRAIWEAALGADHPNMASSDNNLAHLYRDRGELEIAERLYRRAAEIRRVTFGDCHDRVLDTQDSLALLLVRAHRIDEAEATIEPAVACADQLRDAGPDSPQVGARLASLLLARGEVTAARGDPAGARRSWERALELVAPLTARSDTLGYLTIHARALLLLGRLDEARPLVERVTTTGYRDLDLERLAVEAHLVEPPRSAPGGSS